MARRILKRRVDKFIISTKQPGSIASYPAMKMEQNKQTFYLATIPVEDIFPFSFVSRRQEDPIKGFQRNLSIDRAREISNYLDKSFGSIPTNIVLSAQENAKLRYISGTKTIKFKRMSRSFLIIDGQHRLYGYGLTTGKHRVPVAIYFGLTRKQEASLFIDINTNQKGVPAALLLDIKQVADKESEVEYNLRYLFDGLAEANDSPFVGFLSPSVSKRGMISRVTFNRGVKPILEHVVMSKLPQETQLKLLINYFVAVESCLEDSSILFKAAYFEAFCALFDDVLQMSYTKFKNYKLDSLYEVVSPIENVDLTGVLTAGKTKITKATIYPILKNSISDQLEVLDDMI